MEIISINSNKTKKIGYNLARKILKQGLKRNAFVIGLKGDLGGGKTTFLQGFAKGLGIKEVVLSPTFILMHKFFIPKNFSNFKFFYHIDCYRFLKAKEINSLDFKKIVSCPKNIVAVEWADKIKKYLPKESLWFEFEFKNKNQRIIKTF